mgnify:CR=1 FL=1
MILRAYIDLNQIQKIPFTSDFENGTGYFDGVFGHPSIDLHSKIVYFVDQYDRHAVLFQTNNGKGITPPPPPPDNEDLLVTTQSQGFSYNHCGVAIDRLLEIPYDEVLSTLNKNDDGLSFVTLLNEKCYFDY